MLRSGFTRFRRRIARAWRYTTDRLTKDDAHLMLRECQNVIGWWPLEEVNLESALDFATEKWRNSEEELRPLVENAARYVAHKWDSNGSANLAYDLIVEHIAESAEDAEPGVWLVER